MPDIYENLSAKDIAEKLKQYIESNNPFDVIFIDDNPISIDLVFRSLSRDAKLQVLRYMDKGEYEFYEINVRIPDDKIFGDGYIAFEVTGNGRFEVGEMSNRLEITRLKHLKSLHFREARIIQ